MDIPEQDKQAFIEAARRRSQQKQGGAAFGVYPSSGKRPEKLNVSRDVNMPAQVARGWVAGTLGLPGDIESLGRMALNFAFGPGGVNVDETSVLPTSEFYQEYLPGGDERPAAKFASGLGALAGGAGSTTLARGAVKGAKATGKALGPKAAEMAEGYLQKSGLAPSVIKPKGGNWLSGSVEKATEPLVPKPGARGRPASETMREMEATYPPDVVQSLSTEGADAINRSFAALKPDVAVEDWINTKLNKYIRNEMGTPEDPVRKLAERGVTHMQNPPQPETRGWVEVYRQDAGYPREGLGQSPLAKGWENVADEAIAAQSAGRLRGALAEFEGAKTTSDIHAGIDRTLVKERAKQLEDTFKDTPSKDLADEFNLDYEVTDANRAQAIEDWARTEVEGYYRGNAEDMLGPHYRHKVGLEAYDVGARGEDLSWLGKIPEDQPVYAFKSSDEQTLGFEHLIDELRNATRADSDLPANLRWKPEDLKKVTMEQAVERVAKINEYRAAKKAEANEVLARNPATMPYKDYQTVPGTQEPNQKGLAWKQIKMPEAALPEGYSARHLPEVDMWGIYDPQGGAAGMGATEREAMGLFRRDERKKSVEDALKYEGEVMGHCVGGYCDDVLSGRSQIYSLRDKKGEPHVTIEVEPAPRRGFREGEGPRNQAEDAALREQYIQESREGVIGGDVTFADWWRSKNNIPPLEPELQITQIKGKGNAAPKTEYLPFVQDFVRSGNWSWVGDFANTGLYSADDVVTFMPKSFEMSRNARQLAIGRARQAGDLPKYMTMGEYEQILKKYAPEDIWKGKEPGYAKGGLVQDTDAIAAKLTGMDKDKALTHALRMANAKQEAHMAAGGLAKLLKGAKKAEEATKAAKATEKVAEAAKPAVIGPQAKALETARKNAVKMLGLPETNTPQDRAKALGFTTDYLHGTQRMDRLLEKKSLDPRRATSGPMPFGTSTPELASGYAMQKVDTSLRAADEGDVTKYFEVAPKDIGLKGMKTPLPVEKAWYFMSPEQRAEIAKLAPRVGYENLDEFTGKFIVHPEGVNATLSPDQWDWIMKREAKGNPLAALREMWHESGQLVDEPEQLGEIYRLAGVKAPISQSNAPWTEAKGVLLGKARITNPLDTANTEQVASVIEPLKQAFARDRSKTSHGPDQWAKQSRYTPKEWVEELERDLAQGKDSYVWTSIPDKVTEELKRLNFNGIIDRSGKGGGAKEPVIIPFEPEQVRSRFAAFDPARINEKDLLGAADPSLLAGTAVASGIGLGALGQMSKPKPEQEEKKKAAGGLAKRM